MEQARTYQGECIQKERALIQALSRRYPAAVDEDQVQYEEAYADALKALAKKYPADDDLQARKQQGKNKEAALIQQQFTEAWKYADVSLDGSRVL